FKMAAQARDTGRPGRTATWPSGPEATAAPEPEERLTAESEPHAQRGRGPQRGGERMPPGRARRERREPDGVMARLFLRVGKRDGVRPADLVGAIANEAGVPGDAIGDIDLYDTFSFVEVPEDMSDIVRAALNATTIRGRQPRATVARPEDSWPEQGERDERPPRDARSRPFDRDNRDRGRRDRFEDRAPSPERRSLRVAGASRLTSPSEAKGTGRGYTARASKLDRRPPKPTRKRP
ncbi:MAG: DbpA RNA binding domain-containing protein, partial [Ktedonobacterales bacterium]